MSLYLMADSDLKEFEALEARSLDISAGDLLDAAAMAPSLQMETKGDTATIKVEGMLTSKRIGFLDFFGKPQTVWGDIVGSIEKAESSGIKNFNIIGDSGGGTVDGMFEAMDAVANTSMNVKGIVSGQAQSAMYMLLSQAGSIESTRPYNMIGNVGVKVGLGESVEVSNTDSPNKIGSRKDDDGKYAIQETLDEIYSMITPRMARGRNTTVEKINSDWGKGGTMTAKTALARGMIDKISEEKVTGRSGSNKGKRSMTKEELKAQFPDLCSAIFEDGKVSGQKEYMETASAHIELAKASGATERALADISAGNPVTTAVIGFHGAEGIKKMQIDARTEEAPPAVKEGEDLQKEAHSTDVDDKEAEIKEYAACGLEVEL